jgi:PDZ domain-containing protein
MRRTSSLVLTLVAVTLAVVAAFAAAIATGAVPCAVVSTQPSCEVALVPGPTEDTLALVDISGATTYPSAGRLLLTTVAVRDDLDLATWWEARRSRTVDTVPRSTVYPEDQGREETSAQNALLMEDSQLTAAFAALGAAGYDVAGAASGAEVAGLEPDVVTDELTVGDVIVAIDGTEVSDAAEAVALVRAGAPGDTAEFTVRAPDGTTRPVTVTYGANPDDRSRAYVGVLLRSAVELPVDVTMDAGAIGGPSAGLMFALGVVDLLGEEDLTGGAVVAGTGTITADGRVGPVGGVVQKVAAASMREGTTDPATVFLVPRANLAEARGAPLGADLLLVPIDDLTGALSALSDLRAGRRPAEAIALQASDTG